MAMKTTSYSKIVLFPLMLVLSILVIVIAWVLSAYMPDYEIRPVENG